MKKAIAVLFAAGLFAGCSPGDDGFDGATADPGAAGAAPAPAAPEEPDVPRFPRYSVEATSPRERSFAFVRPEHVRGLYVNAWSAGASRRMAELIDLARRTEVNAFVIDVKDATGYVSYASEAPLAQAIGAGENVRIRDMAGLLARLQEAGVYPIARIVIAKDPLLVAARPETAVQDTAGGVWVDHNDAVWLNLFHREVWEYHIELAREAAAMGFPEVQWDYVRFPDAPASALKRARFPGQGARSRVEAIRNFLVYGREALSETGLEITADVFGVTTSAGDVGIGQVWESFIDVVDVALPMIYPSHYWKGSFGYDNPNAHPYEIVRKALESAVRRSAAIENAGAIRPWLQDFTLDTLRYEAPEVRAQIQAAYDAGVGEWALWNAGSRYTEAALEPVEGFSEEPLIRIANGIVPVSRRFDLLNESAGPEEVAPEAGRKTSVADTAEPAEAVD